MTEFLNTYFNRYAQAALEAWHECALADNYYGGIERRLEAGQDLSDELPEIKKLGPKRTKKVVKTALKEYANKQENLWQLPLLLQEHCTSKITPTKEYGETVPRFNIAHVFATEAGTVKVFISTKGNNYQIDIKGGRNKMAALAAMEELEKLISFSSLVNKF